MRSRRRVVIEESIRWIREEGAGCGTRARGVRARSEMGRRSAVERDVVKEYDRLARAWRVNRRRCGARETREAHARARFLKRARND